MKIVFYFFSQRVEWDNTPDNIRILDANKVAYTIE